VAPLDLRDLARRTGRLGKGQSESRAVGKAGASQCGDADTHQFNVSERSGSPNDLGWQVETSRRVAGLRFELVQCIEESAHRGAPEVHRVHR